MSKECELTNRNPTIRTLEKVLKALKNAEKPVSAFFITKQSQVDHTSVIACLNYLIKQGKVTALSTTNGIFYSLRGDSS